MKSVKLLGSLQYGTATLFETELDLFKSLDAVPSINKSSFNIEQLENATGDYTLGIKLPKTSNNDAFFEYIATEYQDFNVHKVYKGRIELAGATLINGRLYLKQINPDSYDITIIGENISWGTGLKDKSLRDIQSLRPIRFTGLRTSLFNPWPNQEPNSVGFNEIWPTTEQSGEYDFNFTLKSYGNFDSDPNDASINPINNLNDIRYSAGVVDGAILYRPADWPFFPLEFKPDGNLRTIIKSIFKDQGYTTVGSFINDPVLDNLILPFTDSNNADPRWNWNLIGQSEWTQDNIGLIDYRVSAIGPGGARDYVFPMLSIADFILLKDYTYNSFNQIYPIYNPTPTEIIQYYQAPVTGYYNINLSFNVSNWINPYRAFIGKLHNESATTVIDYYTLGGGVATDVINSELGTADILVTGNGSYNVSGTIFLNRNDKISLLFNVDVSDPTLTDYTIEITPILDENSNNWSFDLNAEVLPDVNQLDLIKSLIEMFNLFVTVDNVNKTVSIDFFDSYFLPAGTALDWNDKTTYKLSTKKPSINFNRVDFNLTHQEGEYYFTPTTNGYTYTNNLIVAKSKNKNSIFSRTAERNYIYIVDIPQTLNTTINIPTLNTKDEFAKILGELGDGSQLLKFDYTPRILKYNGPITVPANYIGDEQTGEYFNISFSGPFSGSLPLSLNVDFLDFNYLFENYYKKQFSNIDKQYIISLPIELNEYDISIFDARIPVKIGQQLYYVILLEDFNPLTLEPVKATLIRK